MSRFQRGGNSEIVLIFCDSNAKRITKKNQMFNHTHIPSSSDKKGTPDHFS